MIQVMHQQSCQELTAQCTPKPRALEEGECRAARLPRAQLQALRRSVHKRRDTAWLRQLQRLQGTCTARELVVRRIRRHKNLSECNLVSMVVMLVLRNRRDWMAHPSCCVAT